MFLTTWIYVSERVHNTAQCDQTLELCISIILCVFCMCFEVLPRAIARVCVILSQIEVFDNCLFYFWEKISGQNDFFFNCLYFFECFFKKVASLLVIFVEWGLRNGRKNA